MSEQYNANCISYWWKVADLEKIVSALIDASPADFFDSQVDAVQYEWEIAILDRKCGNKENV
jgi:hypothetical protein